MTEHDIEELAYRSMGKTEEEAESEINDGDIDDAIYEKYEYRMNLLKETAITMIAVIVLSLIAIGVVLFATH